MKTYVVGDIHGAYKALKQAVERSPFNPEKDLLIQLGDVADGWSQTPEVVDYLINLPNKILIRGNHDQWCNTWMQTTQALPEWVSQGGRATKDAYQQLIATSDRFGLEGWDAHKLFFKYQHDYHVDDDNRLYIHAGYTSYKGVGHESYRDIYFWDRRLWNVAMSGRDKGNKFRTDEQKDPKLLRPYKEIFIGHTTTMSWDTDKPMNACNVWNMDTGGGYGGKVTIMDVDTKEYWQSDKCKELYPNEMGR